MTRVSAPDTDRAGTRTPASGPASDAEVRMIDAGTSPTRFARGWHCLGLAEPVAEVTK